MIGLERREVAERISWIFRDLPVTLVPTGKPGMIAVGDAEPFVHCCQVVPPSSEAIVRMVDCWLPAASISDQETCVLPHVPKLLRLIEGEVQMPAYVLVTVKLAILPVPELVL